MRFGKWKDGTFRIHSGGLFFCFQDKRMRAFLGFWLGICLDLFLGRTEPDNRGVHLGGLG